MSAADVPARTRRAPRRGRARGPRPTQGLSRHGSRRGQDLRHAGGRAPSREPRRRRRRRDRRDHGRARDARARSRDRDAAAAEDNLSRSGARGVRSRRSARAPSGRHPARRAGPYERAREPASEAGAGRTRRAGPRRHRRPHDPERPASGEPRGRRGADHGRARRRDRARRGAGSRGGRDRAHRPDARGAARAPRRGKVYARPSGGPRARELLQARQPHRAARARAAAAGPTRGRPARRLYAAPCRSRGPWAGGERILALVGPDGWDPPPCARCQPYRRPAARALVAVTVEAAGRLPSPAGDASVAEALALAGRLGGRVERLVATDLDDESSRFARKGNFTQIFVGRSRSACGARRWRRSLVGALVRRATCVRHHD